MSVDRASVVSEFVHPGLSDNSDTQCFEHSPSDRVRELGHNQTMRGGQFCCPAQGDWSGNAACASCCKHVQVWVW